MRDRVDPAIDARAFGLPAVEHRADRALELFADVLRERATELGFDDRLIFADQRAPVIGGHFGIVGKAAILLGDFQRFLEQAVVEAEDDVGVHLDEAAIAVPGEARVARSRGEPFDGGIVEAEIEDGVHHAGHRDARARADRNEQRAVPFAIGVAEAFAGGAFDMRDAVVQRGEEIGGEAAIGGDIGRAVVRADGDPRRHGQPDRRHAGQVCPLAAEQVLVARDASVCSIARPAAEAVDRLGSEIAHRGTSMAGSGGSSRHVPVDSGVWSVG